MNRERLFFIAYNRFFKRQSEISHNKSLSITEIKKQEKDNDMRFLFFLICYGLVVLTATHMILYLNYHALGYPWSDVFIFILKTVDFKIFLGACLGLITVFFFPSPSRTPFS